MESKGQVGQKPIFKICLTGGPCAGKTTALSFLKEKLVELGFQVFSVLEVACMTVQGGGLIIFNNFSQERLVKFESALIKIQMQLEDYFIELARIGSEPSVILCDRGVMDAKAYLSEENFQYIVDQEGWNVVGLRDKRYDGVIHLVTAAEGAPEFYTTLDHKARHEGIDEAQRVDKKTLESWVGHPHLKVIDNTEKGFDRKMEKCLAAVLKIIGQPISKKSYRKYLIENDFHVPAILRQETFTVEELYLKSDNQLVQRKIRKRGQNNTFTYAQSTRNLEGDDRKEVKKQINAGEYMSLYSQRDEELKPVFKKRISFLHEYESYVIDIFLNLEDKISLLRIEAENGEVEVKIPDFIKVIKEVTGDEAYSTHTIASRK